MHIKSSYLALSALVPATFASPISSWFQEPVNQTAVLSKRFDGAGCDFIVNTCVDRVVNGKASVFEEKIGKITN